MMKKTENSKFENAVRALEFDKIREKLAYFAPTEGSKALARALMPTSSAIAVKKALAEKELKLEDKLQEKLEDIYCEYVPQAQREQIEERIESAEANGDYIYNPELEESHYEEYERYKTYYENAPEELIPVDDYENGSFLVDYNNMEYELYINEYGIELMLLDKYI